MIYINKEADIHYIFLEEALDNESYRIGSTWEDYDTGAWVPLSDGQIAFREENPTASVREVFDTRLIPVPEPVPDPEPTPERLLERARKLKLREIEEADNNGDRFYVSVRSGGVEVDNVELWIGKDLRDSLYGITLPALLSDGETETTLWSATVPPRPLRVPISWAMEKLPLLEIYAKRTYDIKAGNEAAAYAATSVGELDLIDPEASYPLFLTFELNLDIK